LLLGFQGTKLAPELISLVADGLAGVAIYPRNFNSPEELRDLTASIRKAAPGPLIIGIDQEGGTRFSLPPPFTAWPSPADLGRLGDASLVERVARAVAVELRAVGVNTNFAPMLDLAMHPDSPVTAGRSFGGDAGEVARLGAASLRGLAAEGVCGCIKHFPGHGDALVDPHFDLPVFNGSRERLIQQELVPFAAAIAGGATMIMTAHILLPHIDPEQPASLSPLVLDGILRKELGFTGVVVADDLGMGALARRYGCGESAVLALRAGSDVVMLCHDETLVPKALNTLTAASGGRLEATHLAASRSRVANLRNALRGVEQPAPPLEVIGCPEHQALAMEIHGRVAALLASERPTASRELD
jgi:beta-N-acetylhexosaminidase